MIQCPNWILVDKYKKDRIAYEEYTKQITNEKIEFAKSKMDELDLKILKLILHLKITTSNQISKITLKNQKNSLHYVNRRLKKLYQLGCIDRFFPLPDNAFNGGSGKTHVVLAPIGAKILKFEKRFRKIISLNQNWRHTVFTNEILADFYSKFKVIDWRIELKLNWSKDNQNMLLRPDAIIGWEEGENELYSMFEVDMGSEHLPIVKQKIKNYILYFNSTEYKNAEWQPYENISIIPNVVFVFNNDERTNKIKQHINRLNTKINFKSVSFNEFIQK